MAKTKLYTFFMGPYKAHIQNGISDSYMDAVFELVAHEESEIWTNLSCSFTKEAYYSSQISRVCVISV